MQNLLVPCCYPQEIILQDLVGDIVILQEYYNSGEEPIEAKYVFPLDEKSAVVGFEAFINRAQILCGLAKVGR